MSAVLDTDKRGWHVALTAYIARATISTAAVAEHFGLSLGDAGDAGDALWAAEQQGVVVRVGPGLWEVPTREPVP